jgi:hypothetical protein
VCCALQIESEFPRILPIKESLIKYVFEPNAAKVRIGVRQKWWSMSQGHIAHCLLNHQPYNQL